MQLVDSNMNSKLFGANVASFPGRARYFVGASHRRAGAGFISQLKTTSAAGRVLGMLLAALVLTASPALLATVRAAVSLSLQILLEAGHAGLIAFQIFGR
jgi:hypothetical protein